MNNKEIKHSSGNPLPPHPDDHISEDDKAIIDRKLVWRLDLTLIPWLCLLYLLAFLDRSNIGNAKVDGIKESLHLSATQFNMTLSVFFVSYSIVEPFTNVLLKRMNPSIFIPIIIVVWGLCMTFMGFVSNWSGLMAARWFLGLAEAGLFPGINYYLSCWYKRSELGIRAAIFFSSAAVSGSFGGLLAFAIAKMEGLGNRPSWAWLFILEGIITIIIGIISFWVIQDFPENAKFLSTEDRIRVIRRLKAEKQSSADHEDFKIKYFWMAIKDYKMWLGMAIFAGTDMPLYAFSLFLPSIISELGYSMTSAQLLTVPPYAVAAILTVLVGWIADRTHQRGLCNIFTSIIGITGFVMLIAFQRPEVKYAGTFLAALGIYPCIPNSISWISNNVEGSYKRGIVLGFVIGWGNLNGIISSNIYSEKSGYIVGHATIIGFLSVFLLGGSLLMRYLLQRENRIRKKGGRDYWLADLDDSALEDMGDARPDFFYTL
ncbi:putative transporter [Golovinomyces cichoracearum]|uniref:Putative transporter n=1 Tax=Golovinomyces cichoracearum TaxID=62708 RepID=A0A420H978_9PEZI|nr:putative transporter [Golovinomyces cichoracearum]